MNPIIWDHPANPPEGPQESSLSLELSSCVQHIKLRFIPRPARRVPIGLFAGVELSGGGPGGVRGIAGVRGMENGDASSSGVAGVVGCISCTPPCRMT